MRARIFATLLALIPFSAAGYYPAETLKHRNECIQEVHLEALRQVSRYLDEHGIKVQYLNKDGKDYLGETGWVGGESKVSDALQGRELFRFATKITAEKGGAKASLSAEVQIVATVEAAHMGEHEKDSQVTDPLGNIVKEGGRYRVDTYKSSLHVAASPISVRNASTGVELVSSLRDHVFSDEVSLNMAMLSLWVEGSAIQDGAEEEEKEQIEHMKKKTREGLKNLEARQARLDCARSWFSEVPKK